MIEYFDPYIPNVLEFFSTKTTVLDPVTPPDASNLVLSASAPFQIRLDWERGPIMTNSLIQNALIRGHSWNVLYYAVNVGTDPSVLLVVDNSAPAGNPSLISEQYSLITTVSDPLAAGIIPQDIAAGHSGVYLLTPAMNLETGIAAGYTNIYGVGETKRVCFRP